MRRVLRVPCGSGFGFGCKCDSDLRHSSVETQSPLNQAIVVLDFGAQYSQLIARRIREQKIFSVVLPFNASLEEIFLELTARPAQGAAAARIA